MFTFYFRSGNFHRSQTLRAVTIGQEETLLGLGEARTVAHWLHYEQLRIGQRLIFAQMLINIKLLHDWSVIYFLFNVNQLIPVILVSYKIQNTLIFINFLNVNF